MQFARQLEGGSKTGSLWNTGWAIKNIDATPVVAVQVTEWWCGSREFPHHHSDLFRLLGSSKPTKSPDSQGIRAQLRRMGDPPYVIGITAKSSSLINRVALLLPLTIRLPTKQLSPHVKCPGVVTPLCCSYLRPPRLSIKKIRHFQNFCSCKFTRLSHNLESS